MSVTAPNMAHKYRAQSLQYLDNADRSLRAGEPAKAGEFLWGSMAEAFKALAANKGVLIKSHGELWKYARVVAKELGDDSLYSVFVEASALHTNFYEAERTTEDIYAIVDRVRQTASKILGLLPEGEAGS